MKDIKSEMQVNYLQISDKQLFKSFQEPSENKKSEEDFVSTPIDYYKEMLNAMEEEKRKVQEELNEKIAAQREEIVALQKNLNDYEILKQKSKIDEIVKTQWKKDAEEAKAKCHSLLEENIKLKNQCVELNRLNESLGMKYQEVVLSMQQQEAELQKSKEEHPGDSGVGQYKREISKLQQKNKILTQQL